MPSAEAISLTPSKIRSLRQSRADRCSVSFGHLQAVCFQRLVADCLTNHPRHPLPYDEHCGETDSECCADNCPVWRQWTQNVPHERLAKGES